MNLQKKLLKNYKKNIKQYNYTNIYIQVLGQQLTRIEFSLELLINKLNQVAQLETPLIKIERN